MHTRGIRRLSTFATGVALLLSACSGGGPSTAASSTPQGGSTSPVRGGTLRLAASNDLVTLDNSQAVSTIDYSMVAGALYEGLYHVDSAGNIVPALASGMPDVSADGMSYTIHLRSGAMFAGTNFTPRAVTADDAAYGLIRALDPKTKPGPSWGGGYLYPIQGASDFAAAKAKTVSGIKVLDPSTLQLQLTQPTSTFVYDLTIATSWPVPKEAVEQNKGSLGDNPVGAGPFYVSSWQKGQSITLKRNPGYVDKTYPYLNGITLNLGVDENTMVLELQNGSIDGVFEPYFLSQASLAQLKQSSNVALRPTVGPTIYYWAVNNTGIFKNLDLRKAVAMAVTRDFVKQFGTEVQPWNQIFSSVTKQSDPSTKVIPHDVTQAKQLLQQGGYSGQPVRIIYEATDPFASAMSTSIRQDLLALGMKVQLRGMQDAEYFSTKGYENAHNYDLLPTYWREDYPDGQDYISTNFTCAQVPGPYGLNVARWCNPQVDKQLAESDKLAFGPQRDLILRQIQQTIIDQAGGIPMMQVNFPVVYTKNVGAMPSLPTYAPIDWKAAWVRS